ncbi:MAG: ATP-dependent zinc protease [Verrucomicrobia bacterium]|nr:ATP-dependent zinc protease [Verrucomicrobiota bacterium]
MKVFLKLSLIMVLATMAGCATNPYQSRESGESNSGTHNDDTAEVAEEYYDSDEDESNGEADEVVEEIVTGRPGKHAVEVPGVGERYVFGWVEWVCIQPEGINIKAKVDSGARTSSMNAQNLVEFERDGQRWVRFSILHPDTKEPVTLEKRVVRFVRIVQHLREPQRRPVIEMEVKLGPCSTKLSLA